MKENLAKIQKIDLRKAWNHEATDFTNWLAEDDNLSLLGDEIGIDITLVQTEANVGKFSVDILAEEENTSRKIIIENQLEITNHDHLGKIITYASGYGAEIIIWIVKDVRDEHKQAIDWLNEHTDEETNFFAIKMELWQIADSPLAPKFQIIAKPNDWAKAIRQSSGKVNLTDTKIEQLNFWNKFNEYASQNKTILKLRNPKPRHWHNIGIGNSECYIALTVNGFDSVISCELYIPRKKEIFVALEKQKEQIEKELGVKNIKWMPLENKKASRIKLSIEGNINETEEWNKYFGWLQETAENFYKIFGKYVKKIK